ncbi:hypothetical protein [Roseomonas marmotae]|uniref:Uncharacterized protein n=1 Tax=Roseomonas marmotae TaxID=2768161 RepID=A0ABS3KB08_9PROT|nr:hypothetical protein [Roseomonas marmotae]MBO1073833.1 hypothetical protein [Roseomonas marmotae]QTI78538.1 hypothetical protein IAI58_12750 [Roseomonas marmotae]
MTAAPRQAVLASIDRMDSTLAVAIALADSGRTLDLGGLEEEMTRLCGAALMLPTAEGQALRPAMAGLLARLERLSAALRR